MSKNTGLQGAIACGVLAAALLACDRHEAAPSSPSGYPTSPTARYALDARAALVVAARQPAEKDKEPRWRGCSGVIVNLEKRLALTAHGCVVLRPDDAPLLCVLTPPSEPARQLMPADIDAVEASGRSRCSVLSDEPDLGLAVLRLEDAPPADARAVQLAGRDPEVGDPVHGVFAPHLVTNVWFTGYVNNRLLWPILAQGSKPQKTFGVSTPVSGAAIGGMVLDEDGRLVGVTVVAVSDTSMGVAIPVSLIAERLAAQVGR